MADRERPFSPAALRRGAAPASGRTSASLRLGPLFAGPRAGEAKVARPGAAIDQALGEAEDRTLERERDQKLRPGDLAVLRFGGLLVGDSAPDEVKDLLRDLSRDQSGDYPDRYEDDSSHFGLLSLTSSAGPSGRSAAR